MTTSGFAPLQHHPRNGMIVSLRVLAISGSLREGSHNTRLLRAAEAMLPPGTTLRLWSSLRDVPPFDEDDEASAPLMVADLRSAISAADAVLIATPEYNASIPGQLKNAVDWVSRPFETNPMRGKPCAVIGASTGLFGAVWAQAELRKVLTTLGADVLDSELPVGDADDAFGADGRLRDAGLASQLAAIVRELIARTAPEWMAA